MRLTIHSLNGFGCPQSDPLTGLVLEQKSENTSFLFLKQKPQKACCNTQICLCSSFLSYETWRVLFKFNFHSGNSTCDSHTRCLKCTSACYNASYIDIGFLQFDCLRSKSGEGHLSIDVWTSDVGMELPYFTFALHMWFSFVIFDCCIHWNLTLEVLFLIFGFILRT